MKSYNGISEEQKAARTRNHTIFRLRGMQQTCKNVISDPTRQAILLSTIDEELEALGAMTDEQHRQELYRTMGLTD